MQTRIDSSSINPTEWVEFWLESDNDVTLHSFHETYRIMYHLKPKDAEIHWESTDEKIATVDDYGVVTAVGVGKCTIIAEVGMVTETGQTGTGGLTSSVNICCKFEY